MYMSSVFTAELQPRPAGPAGKECKLNNPALHTILEGRDLYALNY